MSKSDVWDAMIDDVNNTNLSDEEKRKLLLNINALKEKKINIMITGATGAGKSSTINALFSQEMAKVGTGVDPETMDIRKYEYKSMILWDSPGLGDGKEKDEIHAKKIINKLLEKDSNGDLLIDLVLVILDGSSRDLGTSYQLINEVIIPNLGENKEKRILIAINQCDVAMKGQHWDDEKNEPDEVLFKFLEDKAESVKKRIKEATNVDVNPIFYSAGYKEEGCEQCEPYNLTKLLSYIIANTPKEKRIVYVENINQNPEMWKHNDNLENYSENIKQSFGETMRDSICDGAEIGGQIGSVFGKGGEVIGKIIGGVGGAIGGVFKSIGNALSGGGCYITTATCQEYGKPDDCYELTSFRRFRDNWLLNQPDGKELIKQYYKTAPAIVDLINKQVNHKEIYAHLRKFYLSPCLSFIENGENEKCKKLYTEMMLYLDKEKQNWN